MELQKPTEVISVRMRHEDVADLPPLLTKRGADSISRIEQEPKILHEDPSREECS